MNDRFRFPPVTMQEFMFKGTCEVSVVRQTDTCLICCCLLHSHTMQTLVIHVGC